MLKKKSDGRDGRTDRRTDIGFVDEKNIFRQIAK